MKLNHVYTEVSKNIAVYGEFLNFNSYCEKSKGIGQNRIVSKTAFT